MQLFQTSDSLTGMAHLRDRLVVELQAAKKVLWLIPGGSNISLSVLVMAELADADTKNLTLALTDERYGPVGHADSNWRQLDDSGFSDKHAKRITVLDDKLDMPATTTQYAKYLQTAFDANDIVIGQFGMGKDGHIAGILPGSPAVTDDALVSSYDAGELQRITMTFNGIRHCHAAYLFAFGKSKLEALQNLQGELPLAEQPAQILRQVDQAFVFNDQIGDM